MIGVGEARVGDRVAPAHAALAEAGLEPIALAAQGGAGAPQRHAILDRQCARRPVQGRDAVPLRPGDRRAVDRRRARIGHAVRRAHPCAEAPPRARSKSPTALRALLQGSAIRASHLTGDERVQDPYCLRCQPQVMGACLDLLRQAAATLLIEANGVSDNPLIFAETDEALSGGNFHAEPVAFAADMIALAICEIGSLAERRIAMLVDPALSGLPAFLTPKPGLNSGFMIAAGDRGGAGRREQDRAPIRPASIRSRPRPTRRTTSRWPRTARGGSIRWRTTQCRSSASSSSRPPRPAIFTSRSGPARRSKRCGRAGAPRRSASRRRPLLSSRHRRGDSLVSRGAVIDAVGAATLPALEGPRDDRRASRLARRRARRGAAHRQHSPRGNRPPRRSSRPSSIRGSRARTRTGGSTSSTISSRRSARRSCAQGFRARSSTSIAIRAAHRSIPARRRPSSARRRPSTASRSIAQGQRPTRPRSPSGGAFTSIPIMRRSRRDRAAPSDA